MFSQLKRPGGQVKEPRAGRGLAAVIFALAVLLPALGLEAQEASPNGREAETAGPAGETAGNYLSPYQKGMRNGLGDLDREQLRADLEAWFRLNRSLETGRFSDKLAPAPNHAFRGQAFGRTLEQVMDLEAGRRDTLFLLVGAFDRTVYYWYYLEDWGLGNLIYHFDSSGGLSDIFVTVIAPPGPDAEGIAAFNAFLPYLIAVFGPPTKKFTDSWYSWRNTLVTINLFAMRAERPEALATPKLAVFYTRPGSIPGHDVEALELEFREIEKLTTNIFPKAANSLSPSP